ncbi:MAG: fatty acid hydroxylase, partial [Pseudomonadota bacterium]
MDTLTDTFANAQQWLFEAVVQPLMFELGLANLLEDGYDATGWLLVGLLQLLALIAVVGPLQRWRPVEPVTDRATIHTDMLYTVLHRLGLFRLVLFFSIDPVFDELLGSARVAGWETFHLDAIWPGVTDSPLASFLLYLVVLDFFNYWVHRGQHQFEW